MILEYLIYISFFRHKLYFETIFQKVLKISFLKFLLVVLKYFMKYKYFVILK